MCALIIHTNYKGSTTGYQIPKLESYTMFQIYVTMASKTFTLKQLQIQFLSTFSKDAYLQFKKVKIFHI